METDSSLMKSFLCKWLFFVTECFKLSFFFFKKRFKFFCNNKNFYNNKFEKKKKKSQGNDNH